MRICRFMFLFFRLYFNLRESKRVEHTQNQNMVNAQKKNENNWQTADAIKTLTQIRSHIDNCKEWLISASSSEIADVNAHFSSEDIVHVSADAAQCKIPNIGMLREEIPPIGIFDCFLCKKSEQSITEGVVVTANPFTRAQCMLLCRACAVA